MKRGGERGLGRGLGALIPRASVGMRDVPLDAITPNPSQPRTHFPEDELEQLAQSIREHGVLQPVLVSEQPDGQFQLIAGERRWRASQLAGLRSVPAVVKEATPRSTLEMALVENIQRRDLNPLEEATAYRQLLDEHGMTQEQLAQRIGKSRVAVTNTLRLLQLPEVVREALSSGEISEGHARAILMADGETRRMDVFLRTVGGDLSVRETEALAREVNLEPPGGENHDDEDGRYADLQRLEEAFRQALGTRVRLIIGRGGTGRLIINFYSEDELQGLYDTIVGG